MITRAQVATLIYHEITDDPRSSGFQRPVAARYAFSPRAFVAHLDALAGAKVRPELVSARGLEEEGGDGSPRFLLTFDDGGRSALDAAELLARRGWHAHFFVVTARLGTRTFLAPGDLRHLRACGHLVGSHSHTHPEIFRDLPRERMLEEWRVSAAAVADILGEPCIAASVPGGDISPQALASAAAAGFHYLFTSEPWLRPRGVDGCWILGRVCLKAGTAPAAVGALAQGRGWTRAWLTRQVKESARRGLAPLYRRYVRMRTAPDSARPGGPEWS